MFKHKEELRIHRKRFILLATLIFGTVGVFHAMRVWFGWPLVVDGIAVPQGVSILASFITLAMAAMGIGYLSIEE